MDLYLSHNPYRIKTTFRIGNRECEDPWFKKLSCVDEMPARLQMWIGQFFDDLHKAYPDEDRFYLTYKGTSADCRDVEEEASSAAERLGVEIKVESQPCGNPEAKFKRLRDLYRAALKGPYKDFHKLELNGDFKKIEDRLLSVSVMAPMKNGKSTLLNAILGRELLPHATQRCTAKISYIEHCGGMEGFEAKRRAEDKTESEYLPCDMKLLSEWNSRADVRSIMIRGSLPGIKVEDCRLQFVDTPGPDSAVHKEDQITIDRFLRDNSLPMVCYIVDRINSSEEGYLARLKKQMSRFGKQSVDRFVFVVSRMDQVAVEKGDTKEQNQIKAKIEGIREDLSRLGIPNPRIIPVSARIALKAREYMTLDEEDQEDVVVDINKFCRGLKRIKSTLLEFSSVSSAIRNKIEAEVSEIQKKIDAKEAVLEDDLRLAELLSGVPTLEMAIAEYATKYSVPARIYDAASIFDEGIKKARAEELLQEEIDNGKNSIEEIVKNLETLQQTLSKGPEVEKMREKLFPKEWVASPVFKNEQVQLDVELDGQINTMVANWRPKTLNEKGMIEADEASAFAKKFCEFMNGLSAKMLSRYSECVEKDARAGFKRTKEEYNAKIVGILGKMPQKLQTFMDRVRFVLHSDRSGSFDIDNLVEETTEKFFVERPITRKKDGFWRAFVSHLPFTETTTQDERQKTVSLVNYAGLKHCLKEEASAIRQEGQELAAKAAKAQYEKLRQLMMKEFARVHEKLGEIKNDMEADIMKKEDKEKQNRELRKTLEWVRSFQEKLKRALELEG